MCRFLWLKLMKRFATVSLLILLFMLPALAVAPAVEKAHKASILIGQQTVVENSVCSATAIGPQAILTATHCEKATDVLFVSGLKDSLTIVGHIRDDADHTIYLVDGFVFANYVKVSLATPEVSDEIFTWGNPGELNNIYQRGFVAGYKRDNSLEAAFGGGQQPKLLFTVQAFPGTSGSGIFNAEGVLVAVESEAYVDQYAGDHAVILHLASAIPLAFKQADIDKAVAFVTITPPVAKP